MIAQVRRAAGVSPPVLPGPDCSVEGHWRTSRLCHPGRIANRLKRPEPAGLHPPLALAYHRPIMFEKVTSSDFVRGEHHVLRFWQEAHDLPAAPRKKCRQTAVELPRRADHRQQPDGRAPRLGTHLQGRLPALFRHDRARLRYQNGFDCQGLWVEVEVERELKMGAKAGHRGLRHRQIRQRLQAARAAIRGPADRAVDPLGLLDGLGRSGPRCENFPRRSAPTNRQRSRRRRAKR